MTIRIFPDGSVRKIATQFDVGGENKIERASHVEPVNWLLRCYFHLLRSLFAENSKIIVATRQWKCRWRVRILFDGHIMGPFYRREDAIAAEIVYLERNWVREGLPPIKDISPAQDLVFMVIPRETYETLKSVRGFVLEYHTVFLGYCNSDGVSDIVIYPDTTAKEFRERLDFILHLWETRENAKQENDPNRYSGYPGSTRESAAVAAEDKSDVAAGYEQKSTG